MNSKTAMERYEQKLREIPSPGGAGCHNFLLAVADAGVMAGMRKSELFDEIRRNIPAGTRRIDDREITSAISKAMAAYADGRVSEFTAPKVKAVTKIDGEERFRGMVEQSKGAQEVDLWEASPYRIEGEYGIGDAIMLLGELYRPNENLFVGDTKDARVYTVAEHIAMIKQVGAVGPHVIANPMTGKIGVKKDGGPSCRCDDTIAAYRFALVEFDNKSKEDQICFWYSMLRRHAFDVACLIDSGGKSIHGWIRVNLKSSEDWDAAVKGYLYEKENGRMAIMGADTNCKNPSRLSRMPGHYRADKKAWQRLIYLNP
jgi:hypothetical protein